MAIGLAQTDKMKKIEEILISVGVEVAKKNEGALFVISAGDIKYDNLLKQKIQKFSIFETGARKLLLSIAMIDGAVVIDQEGMVLDYGAKIHSSKTFSGYGTRHSAAYSASLGSSVAILVSQEEKKIKIFKKGKVIVQIDALEKDVEKHVSDANHVLQSVGVGTLTTIGVSALAPGLGIAVVPGIILFGVPYYLYRKFVK